MDFEKEYEIEFVSKDPIREDIRLREVFTDSEWDKCIARYRELEGANYTVKLVLREITSRPILSHNEKHIHV